MGYTLPEYIGFPGFQYTVSGANAMTFENQMLQTLQIAEMRPIVPQMTKDLNIYGPNQDKAWTEFKSYLTANEISTDKVHDEMKGFKVVLSNIVPLSESYTNEYGQSELFGGLQNMASGGAQEIAQLADLSDGEQFLKDLNEKGGIVGEVAGGLLGGVNKLSDLAGKLSEKGYLGQSVKDDLHQMLLNPTHKISIPLMWKGCSFSTSYQITTRLYCYAPLDDDLYCQNILAPLATLMMFALPRSSGDGKFYFTPFMVDFKIPGQVHIPMGFCQSLDVVKGGDVADISWIKRPGTIDVRMVINTVYGVKTNSLKKSKSSFSPTIMDELTTLYMKDNDDANINKTLDESTLSEAQKQEIEDSRNEPYSEKSEEAINALLDK